MEFAVGDVVQLKSGGAIMTVEAVGKHHLTQEDIVDCVWFESVGKKQEVCRDSFPPAALKKSEPFKQGMIRVERG
jgi:uncharacterized protein YodC (DUF2158 family)